MNIMNMQQRKDDTLTTAIEVSRVSNDISQHSLETMMANIEINVDEILHGQNRKKVIVLDTCLLYKYLQMVLRQS